MMDTLLLQKCQRHMKSELGYYNISESVYPLIG